MSDNGNSKRSSISQEPTKEKKAPMRLFETSSEEGDQFFQRVNIQSSEPLTKKALPELPMYPIAIIGIANEEISSRSRQPKKTLKARQLFGKGQENGNPNNRLEDNSASTKTPLKSSDIEEKSGNMETITPMLRNYELQSIRSPISSLPTSTPINRIENTNSTNIVRSISSKETAILSGIFTIPNSLSPCDLCEKSEKFVVGVMVCLECLKNSAEHSQLCGKYQKKASKWKKLFFLSLILYAILAILVSILVGIYWDEITEKENSSELPTNNTCPNQTFNYIQTDELIIAQESLRITQEELYTYHMLNVTPPPYCYYFADNVYSVQAYSVDQIDSMDEVIDSTDEVNLGMKITGTKNNNSHGRLDMNGQGLVIGSSSIYAAHQGSPIGYIYRISNLNTEVLELPINQSLKNADAIGSDCFFQKDNDYVAYCCSRNSRGEEGSNFLRYELDNTNNITSEEVIVFEKDVQFISCTQTTAGYLVAGALGIHSPNAIYIYDPTKEKGANNLTKLESEEGSHAYQIIEIKDNIILVAQGKALNIFNLQKYPDNSTIPSLSHKPNETWYISATRLLLSEEKEDKEYIQFVIVGHSKEDNYRQGGLVQIYKYYPDENILSLLKEKSDIKNTDKENNIKEGDEKQCEFISVREMRPGLIYFGGNTYCNLVCTWEYLQSPKPFCYNYPTNSSTYIVDFIKDCYY